MTESIRKCLPACETGRCRAFDFPRRRRVEFLLFQGIRRNLESALTRLGASLKSIPKRTNTPDQRVTHADEKGEGAKKLHSPPVLVK